MKKYFVLVILSLIVFFNVCIGQAVPEHNGNIIRMGDDPVLFSLGQAVKSTYYHPVLITSPVMDYTSPFTLLSINGVEFNSFPLNFKSIDLLPIEYLNIENIKKAGSTTIDFEEKKIPDTAAVRIKGFAGSETGDPVIYAFVGDHDKINNKNKIIPAGSFTYSNKNESIAYRITGGYYGYFSTGAENDEFIKTSAPDYFNKQNKQFLGSGEAEYILKNKSKIKLHTALMTFYGWEVTPFIPVFTHFETYISRMGIGFVSTDKNLRIDVLRDGHGTQIHAGNFNMDSKFSKTNYFMNAQYNFIPGELFKIKSVARIGFTELSNGDYLPEINSKFYQKETTDFNYSFSSNVLCYLSEKLNTELAFELANDYGSHNSFSWSGKANYYPFANTIVDLFFSVKEYLPTDTELFGHFYFNDGQNSWDVNGNQSLQPQTLTTIEVGTEYCLGSFNVEANAYHHSIDKRISLISNSAETEYIYKNRTSKISASGIKVDLSYAFGQVEFYSHLNYNFGDISAYPEKKICSSIGYKLPWEAGVFVDLNYTSKINFEDLPQSFLQYNTENMCAEYFTVNLELRQRFSNFIFNNRLTMSIKAENAFNRKLKFFPLGNTQGRKILIVALLEF